VRDRAPVQVDQHDIFAWERGRGIVQGRDDVAREGPELVAVREQEVAQAALVDRRQPG